MRKYYINYPQEFETVYEEDTYEGEKYLKPLNVGKVYLERTGSEFDTGRNYIEFKRVVNGEDVSGDHLKRREPSGQLMPRSFSSPFKILYRYKTTESSLESYIGQSNSGVKEFKRMETNDLSESDPYYSTKYLHNNRFVSYKSMLIMVNESVDVDTNKTNCVNVYRYYESAEQFNLSKRFKGKPIDDSDIGTKEIGSPDAVVLNGYLYIIYRRRIRNSKKDVIQVYRTKDEDLIEWEDMGAHTIEGVINLNDHAHDLESVDAVRNNHVVYEEFRLRASTGGGAIMVATYGTMAYQTVGGSFNRQLKDFRTFVSFDEGYNFKTKDNDGANVIRENSSNMLSSGRTSNYVDYFVPSSVNDNDSLDDYIDYSVNFDLYYDKDMGSFVILKAGDPPTDFGNKDLYNDCYLMGIKTEEGSFFRWERCLKYPVNYKATGISNSATNPYDETEGQNNADYHAYRIKDICVVPGDTYSDIYLSVFEQKPDSNSNETNGVAHAEFRFVNSSQFKSGDYDVESLTAYGGKYHDRFIFSTTPINVESGGVISIGMRHTLLFEQISGEGFGEVFATKWRNQLVSAFEYGGRKRCIAIEKPWTKYSESVPYEHNYCRYVMALHNFSWTEQVSSGGSTSWNKFTGWNSASVNSSGENAYFEIHDTSDNKNPLSRAGDITKRFKVKFDVNFTSGFSTTNFVEFARAVCNDGSNGYFIRLFADDSGNIYGHNDPSTIGNSSNANINAGSALLSLDYTKDWKILFGVFRHSDDDSIFSILAKEKGDQFWSQTYAESISQKSGSLNNGVQLGVKQADQSTEVSIGDVHISALGQKYRNIYDEQWSGSMAYQIEGVSKAVSFNAGRDLDADFIKHYDNSIVLHDGAKINFQSSFKNTPINNDFKYINSISQNSSGNTLNNMADSVFEFDHLSS